jgi:hypothetical protein
MRKGLSGIASHLLVLLLLAVLVVLPSVPVGAQGAGQTLNISMVPIDIEEEIGGSISVKLPSGYELWKANPDEISWGGETVNCIDYEYHGTKVFSVVTFTDGSQRSALGEQADGIGCGGGVLYIRGPVDIQAEAKQYLRPYVEGTIYEEGTIDIPGVGASYPAYYYLSTHTEEHTSIMSQSGGDVEYQWASVHHTLDIRVALSQSQPLYTVTLWVQTWGLPDGIHSDGLEHTYTIDGQPQLEQHKKYIKDILSSITVSGWKAPTPAPVPSGKETRSPPQVSTPSIVETPTPQEIITYPPATSAELDEMASDYPRAIIYFISRDEYESGELKEVPEEAWHLGPMYEGSHGRWATFKKVLEGESRYWMARIRHEVWWIYYLQDEIERLARYKEDLEETVSRYPESGNRDLIPFYEQLIRDTIALLEDRIEMLAESIAEAEACGYWVTAEMKNWVMHLTYYPESLWSKWNIPKAGSTIQRREELTPEQQQEKLRTQYENNAKSLAEMRQQLARVEESARQNLGNSQKLTENFEGFREDVTQELQTFLKMAVGNLDIAASERLGYLYETIGEKEAGELITDLHSVLRLEMEVAMDSQKNDTRGIVLKVCDAMAKTFLKKMKGSEIFKAGAKKGLFWASLALDSVYTLLSVDTCDQIGTSLDRQLEGYDSLVKKTEQEVRDLVDEITKLEEEQVRLREQMTQ